MRITDSNELLILIHAFTHQIYCGSFDKSTFHKLIDSNLKLNLKQVISMILIDTKVGNWNIANQDAQYLIDDINNRIWNGYGIINKVS